jgi:hypothetical protein
MRRYLSLALLVIVTITLAIGVIPAQAQDPCRDKDGNEICPHYNSFDSRVNYLDPLATMTAFCLPDGALQVWIITNTKGAFAYIVPAEKMKTGLANAISTQQVVVVGDGLSLQVLALPSNEYRLHDGRTGYEFTFSPALCGISVDATASTTSSSGSSQPPAAVVASANDVKTVNIVKFRSSPQLGSRNVIGYVPNATVLKVIGRSADSQWLNIEFDGKTGWVATSFTTIRNRVLRALPVITP